MAVAISGNLGRCPARLNQFSSSSKVSRFDILPFYPPLYAWIEEHRPDLFAAIQQQQKLGAGVVYGWSRSLTS